MSGRGPRGGRLDGEGGVVLEQLVQLHVRRLKVHLEECPGMNSQTPSRCRANWAQMRQSKPGTGLDKSHSWGERDNRLRALRAARPHTVGYVGVCDQKEGMVEWRCAGAIRSVPCSPLKSPSGVGFGDWGLGFGPSQWLQRVPSPQRGVRKGCEGYGMEQMRWSSRSSMFAKSRSTWFRVRESWYRVESLRNGSEAGSCFQADRLWYHSTLGSRVIMKNKKKR